MMQTSPYPRYSLTVKGDELFLLDQATGCVWKRTSDRAGFVSWNVELKIIPGSSQMSMCYVGLDDYIKSKAQMMQLQDRPAK